MTEEQINKLAEEIVTELICYNKIKISVKNMWIERIIKFIVNDKPDYNLFQHSKIMKVLPKTTVEHDGIGMILEMIRSGNNIPDHNALEDKEEKPELYGAELKASWRVEFERMIPRHKIDKCIGWLSCGCPENVIPKFVFEHIETLEDKDKELLRIHFKTGRDKWSHISGSSCVAVVGL